MGKRGNPRPLALRAVSCAVQGRGPQGAWEPENTREQVYTSISVKNKYKIGPEK